MALTSAQRSALWEDSGALLRGRIIVSARPGTGKTTVLNQYCRDLLKDWLRTYEAWQGLAALSYTNVAKEELENRLKGAPNLSSDSQDRFPHFLGTLDSFVNQMIFLPFGQSYMGCSGRPRLVGEPHRIWRFDRKGQTPKDQSSPKFFANYSMSKSGPIVADKSRIPVGGGHVRPPEPVTEANSSKIENMKRRLWTEGVATQADANHIASELLTTNPLLVSSLRGRFPVVLIDEAQDMTAAQHAIIDALVSRGLSHVVLVGDELQAIYEWNTARPELFLNKKDDSNIWLSRPLSKTFRCGPTITRSIGSFARSDFDVEPTANCAKYADWVRVATYDPDGDGTDLLSEISCTIERVRRLEPHSGRSGDSRSVAVLAKSTADAEYAKALYLAQPIPRSASDAPLWDHRLTKALLFVIFHLCSRNYGNAFSAYEKAVMISRGAISIDQVRSEFSERWRPEAQGQPIRLYRERMMDDLIKLEKKLPSLNPTISESAACFEESLRGVPAKQLQLAKDDCRSFNSANDEKADRRLSAIFSKSSGSTRTVPSKDGSVSCTFSNVHGVKGETYDAVIFFVRRKTGPCGCEGNSSSSWSKILDHAIETCEAKRIAYVAISRAAQGLTVLAPESSVRKWRAALGEQV